MKKFLITSLLAIFIFSAITVITLAQTAEKPRITPMEKDSTGKMIDKRVEYKKMMEDFNRLQEHFRMLSEIKDPGAMHMEMGKHQEMMMKFQEKLEKFQKLHMPPMPDKNMPPEKEPK